MIIVLLIIYIAYSKGADGLSAPFTIYRINFRSME